MKSSSSQNSSLSANPRGEFLSDRRGATAVEYGFIALGIAVAIIAAIPPVGSAVVQILESVAAGFGGG